VNGACGDDETHDLAVYVLAGFSLSFRDGLYTAIPALGSPDRLGGHVDGALLILYPDGGTLLSYTRGSSGIATVRARGIGAAAEVRFAERA